MLLSHGRTQKQKGLRDDDDDFQITRKVKLEFGYVKHVVVKLNSYHESIGDNFSGLKKS